MPREQAVELLRAGDVLPVPPFDVGVTEASLDLVDEFRAEYATRLPSAPQVLKIQVELPGGGEIVGEVPRFHAPENTIAFVTFSTDDYKKKLDEMSIRTIAAIAAGHTVQRVDIFIPHEKENKLSLRQIEIQPSFDQARALGFLDALVEIEPLARSTGFGQFGRTARQLYAPVEGGRGAPKTPQEHFEEFVDNERGYPKSRELIVFGPNPDFDSLFGPSRTVVSSFFVKYFGLVDTRQTKKFGRVDGGLFS